MAVDGTGAALLRHPDHYRGQTTVAIAASQIDGLSAREQARLIDDWCAFFGRGPSDIWDLAFPMRMSKRLFGSLASQTQLRRLAVGWGVFDDLAPVTEMSELRELELRSAPSVTTLHPLLSLKKLETLQVGNAGRVRDWEVMGGLTSLRKLAVSNGESPRERIESIAFLTKLRSLRQLTLGLVPDDLDYTPLLEMTWVEDMLIANLEKHRKHMTPSMMDLEWALPGLQNRLARVMGSNLLDWSSRERYVDEEESDD